MYPSFIFLIVTTIAGSAAAQNSVGTTPFSYDDAGLIREAKSVVTKPGPVVAAHPRGIPSPLYGITVETTDGRYSTSTVQPMSIFEAAMARVRAQEFFPLAQQEPRNFSAELTESLAKLPHKPTTRVVFQPIWPVSEYVQTLPRIHGVSYVMGEILDSFFVSKYSVGEYLARTSEYLGALGDNVDIWEIGNEINGEWLGKTPEVAAKMAGAYDIVKAAGKTTALTLYYNQGCSDDEHEVFSWAQANVPERMKQGLDYVFLSYYEADCEGLRPDWSAVFHKLATMFPNSKLGIGECGTKPNADLPQKADYIYRYYRMNPGVSNFVGGYFWWYYSQDMVPYTQPLWGILSNAMSGPSSKR